jgi:hypothetical protein
MKGTKLRGNLANKVNETQGKSGKQGRTIVRRPIAIAMGQGGSFEIGSQIFPDFVQAQTVTDRYSANFVQSTDIHQIFLKFVPPSLNMRASLPAAGFSNDC